LDVGRSRSDNQGTYLGWTVTLYVLKRMNTEMRPFSNAAVEAKFMTYPPKIRRKLLALRELIFRTATATASVGELEECLKWGQPSYLTLQTRSGSTVRIDWKPSSPKQYAMYFHCQTNLVETFRTRFLNEFKFEGNRAIIFNEDDRIPIDSLALCVNAALTYHQRKSGRRNR